jgi:hypothetical protein
VCAASTMLSRKKRPRRARCRVVELRHSSDGSSLPDSSPCGKAPSSMPTARMKDEDVEAASRPGGSLPKGWPVGRSRWYTHTASCPSGARQIAPSRSCGRRSGAHHAAAGRQLDRRARTPARHPAAPPAAWRLTWPTVAPHEAPWAVLRSPAQDSSRHVGSLVASTSTAADGAWSGTVGAGGPGHGAVHSLRGWSALRKG